MTKREVNDWLHDVIDDLMYIAGTFEVGTVLERRGDFVNVRRALGQEAG